MLKIGYLWIVVQMWDIQHLLFVCGSMSNAKFSLHRPVRHTIRWLLNDILVVARKGLCTERNN